MPRDKTAKCAVKGCTNHESNHMFIGGICYPCHLMVTKGEITSSGAWFVARIAYLEKLLKENGVAF